MKIIVLDTETTCLDMSKTEIWQFSGVCIDVTNKIKSRFNYNFKTKLPVSYNARVRCNITPEEIEKYPDFDKDCILKELYLNEPDVYYVGHNVSFDRDVIISVLSRAGLKPMELNNLYDKNRWIDTLRLAKHIYEGVEVNDCSGTNNISFALGYLFHYLHLYDVDEKLNFHDARFDVDITLRLLKHCANKLECKLPDDVKTLADISNQPVYITKFTFGKHKDETLEDVWNKDKSYFKWLIEKSGMFDEGSPNYNSDLVYTVEKIING